MPLVFYERESNTRGKVTFIHYMPDDPKEGLPEEVKAKGIRIDSIPEPPQPQPGKSAIPYVNPQTGEFWYELIDRPLTPEEHMEELSRQNLDLMAAIADIAVRMGVI